MSDTNEMSETNEHYEPPTLKVWGKVEEFTAAGCTRPGGDAKSGSVLAPGLDSESTDKGKCTF